MEFELYNNTKFRVKGVKTNSNELILGLIGIIDEDTNFDDVFRDLKSKIEGVKVVAFDTSGLERMNSCGIREWLLFLEKLDALAPFQFTVVNSVFAEAATVVPTVLGKKGCKIRSFEAPYFCNQCTWQVFKKITPSQVIRENDEIKFPEFKCETCQTTLIFDGIADEFSIFLDHLE